MIILDLFGSGFALCQLVSDLINANGTISYNINTMKLFMATISLAFDISFLLQHYVLFKEASQADNRKRLHERKRE